MTTQHLAALDLLLTVAATVLFLGVAALVLSGRAGPRTAAIGALAACIVAGLVVLARVAVVAVLAGDGWWFVADKVWLGLPLAVIAAGFAALAAGPALVRAVRGAHDERARRRAAAGLFIAGYGSAVGLLVVFVVGYPVGVVSAMVVVSLTAGLSGLTWIGLTGRGGRGPVAALLVVVVVPVLASAGLAFYRHLQPVVVGAAGGGHHLAAAASSAGSGTAAGGVSVADLRTPADSAPAPGGQVRRFTLTARQQQVTLLSGRIVDGWTFGSLPGPEIRVRQGDLAEVTLVNADIAAGVTLHWHGYRVPNGEDGVAGVTQDAVPPGESFIYRFVAADAGTYWYHAHQVSSEAVARGLFGALVVEPVDPDALDTDRLDTGPGGTDLVVPVHTFAGVPVVGDTDGVLSREVPAREPVRVRLINTDPVPHRISVDAPVTVAAVDGTELVGPAPIQAQVLRIPAGGRYDVVLDMPDGPVGFGLEGAPATGLRLVPAAGTGADAGTEADAGPGVPFVDGADLDLLTYGTPATAPDPGEVTREATLVLDRQFRFLDGIPTMAQTVNGEVYPFVPPIEVGSGDLLRLTVVNRGGETHPMHPHGHRVLVESRNGQPVRGSPLWLDTFDVQPGEVWTVLLRADNPGIWMAHCHNLEHAAQGMVVHLTYPGVTTPYAPGAGPTDNRPE